MLRGRRPERSLKRYLQTKLCIEKILQEILKKFKAIPREISRQFGGKFQGNSVGNSLSVEKIRAFLKSVEQLQFVLGIVSYCQKQWFLYLWHSLRQKVQLSSILGTFSRVVKVFHAKLCMLILLLRGLTIKVFNWLVTFVFNGLL